MEYLILQKGLLTINMAFPILRCPFCKWEGIIPYDLVCPAGHDLTPWEPLVINNVYGVKNYMTASEAKKLYNKSLTNRQKEAIKIKNDERKAKVQFIKKLKTTYRDNFLEECHAKIKEACTRGVYFVCIQYKQLYGFGVDIVVNAAAKSLKDLGYKVKVIKEHHDAFTSIAAPGSAEGDQEYGAYDEYFLDISW
jgi:hypothetical protein